MTEQATPPNTNSSGPPGRKAAFIDRDGVINEERGFVHRIEDFVFIPGALEALKALRAAGYLLVVISNQSGIARGLYSESDYQQLTASMRGLMLAVGLELDGTQYCPHLANAPVERYRRDCDCRKPRPGMILQAARDLNIELSTSILIGDRATDLEAGRSAGVGCCYLVRTGCELTAEDIEAADAVFDDIAACVRHVAGAGRKTERASPRAGRGR
ncbi:MAG: D-glycero-beta-D-manno-heptose 1,7-bisphosphate 7-phosphatase [Gammaproteobacteria bacterium]|nr:D-glycero-beta-D-manno-heptose 1,7-bisphosphate 7-phosphatase [Gammaproteobacteria bacterium]